MRFNFSTTTQAGLGFEARGTTPFNKPFSSSHKLADGIQVYSEDDKPAQSSCKEIGLLTNDGRVFEREEIEATFIKRAREMGGNALILQEPVKSMEAPKGWD